MECIVKCYKNTGFNAVNLPDSPQTLNQATYQLYAGFDLASIANLSEIKIRLSISNNDVIDSAVGNVDYCCITPATASANVEASYYYIVTGYTALTSDTAVLYLLPDYLTTLGGVRSLDYLDGVTDRYIPAIDTLFEYVQDDELMAPAEPLELEVQWYNDYESGSKAFVESTIDLLQLGSQFDAQGNFTGAGMLFTDSSATVTSDRTVIYDSDGGITGTSITDKAPTSVVMPYISGVSNPTEYHVFDGGDCPAPATCLYDASSPNIKRALGAVRALAKESTIVSQTIYPESVDITETDTGVVTDVSATRQTTSSDFAFDKYDEKYKKRLCAGKYNAIGLITVSGEKIEVNPENIYGDESNVSFISTCDPRPDGKPYYRFKNYMGNTYGKITDLMMGSVSGLQWQSAPLVYTAPSGSYMDRLNYRANAASAQVSYGAGQTELQNAQYYNDERHSYAVPNSVISSVASLVASIKNGGTPAGNLYSLYTDQSNYEESKRTNQNSQLKNELEYNIARQKELANYAYSQAVVTPQVVVPFNANYLRDFAGNGVLLYRYNYSANDQKRIDRLLRLFGYKITKAIDRNMFNAHKYFDYVQAHGVSIANELTTIDGKSMIYNNRATREGAAAQLAAGARFWHVIPTVDGVTDSLYNN